MPRASTAEPGCKGRHAALALVRPVGARNPERFGPVVGSEVRACTVWSCLFEPKLPSISSVGEASTCARRVEIRHWCRPRPPPSNPGDRRSTPSPASSRTLPEDLMRRAPVPVHLDVVVVAVGLRRPRQEQVVLQPVVGAGVVRRRIERLNRLRDTADPVRRNHLFGNCCAPGAIGVAGLRVIQPEGRGDRQSLR